MLTELSRERSEADHFVRETIHLAGPEGVSMLVERLRPERHGCGVVIVMPGLNARFDQVVGRQTPDYPGRDAAAALARLGLCTVTMDLGLASLNAAERASLHLRLAAEGTSVLARLVERVVALRSWLVEESGSTDELIGLVGQSLGAAVALHTALVVDTLTPVVAAGYFGTFGSLLASPPMLSPEAVVPGLPAWADLPDLFGALAPAPLQIQYGDQDPFLDLDACRISVARVHDWFDACGAAGKADVREVAMGHSFDAVAAAAFLRPVLAVAAPAGSVPAARLGFDPQRRRAVLEHVDEALCTGTLTLGPRGRELEELAERWTGAPTLTVSSGTAALEMCLRVIGVAGRRVLVPVNTFFATASAAIHAGAAVELVDIELNGLGIDVDEVEALLAGGGDIAAVVTVHIAGIVSPEIDRLRQVCSRYGVALIEDAAHALGSTWRGAPAGSLGDLAAFSLYPTKVVTSGEGGFVAAPSETHRLELLRLRDQGKKSFYENIHTSMGSNWRMSELHAAVGLADLATLQDKLVDRRATAAWFDRELTGIPGMRVHPVPAEVETNVYKYVVWLDDGIDREALRVALRAHGVNLAGGVYDTPLCDQPVLADARGSSSLAKGRQFSARHICLPILPDMTDGERGRVVEAIAKELPACSA